MFSIIAVVGFVRCFGARGFDAQIVQCLRSFYRQLRRRCRYKQMDGSEWFMASGLAQGCPDLMNILFEPFHRWAAAQNKDVSVANSFGAPVGRVVGIELGAMERAATEAHLTPRLQKALQTGSVRLKAPASGSRGSCLCGTGGSETVSRLVAAFFFSTHAKRGESSRRAGSICWKPEILGQ